ncbi:MAG: glucose-1-phosphate adenylyltransferase subunit GlgD [Oscillospiraceae bacterium]|nr:glucose-1-phosphate adenylyltransferase subunit GlgD [Oscillospiraceae bacterium]
MQALGIVFSDIHEWDVGALTTNRTVAAIPFAGRYWLIDFVLSNMINSGIHKVGVITKSNYQPLMEHIGSGKDWDLSRKNGGIAILPPYGEDSRAGLYRGRLDALTRIANYISNSPQEFVVMSDCDMICNINYKNVIDFHIKSGADITAVYNEHYIDKESAAHSTLYTIPEDSSNHNPDRITEVYIEPWYVEGGTFKVSMNTWVMRKDYMLNMIANSIATGKTHLVRDILLAEVDNINIAGYEHKGYCAHINSINNYFKYNIEMLDNNKRNELFYNTGRNVYTKVRDSEPARYGENANVRNSLVADACIIDGTVENSVIFRGVKVSKNSVVKNCVVMQDGIIGEDCNLEWIIADKGVIITDGKKLTADKEYLMYITKNKRI